MPGKIGVERRRIALASGSAAPRGRPWFIDDNHDNFCHGASSELSHQEVAVCSALQPFGRCDVLFSRYLAEKFHLDHLVARANTARSPRMTAFPLAIPMRLSLDDGGQRRPNILVDDSRVQAHLAP